jgi:hypothetical protein
MSTVATPQRAVRSTALTDRFLAAVPLASLYVWLSALYAVEAWQRVTPWLFGDELKFTQLSRAIAATGHAAERGQPHGAGSIYTYLSAVWWLIDDVAKAYAAIKYMDVLVMAAVVFPTYFLARLVVGRTAALFAAAGAGVIPSMAYSSYLVEEPLAYPWAVLCFFLIAKALVVRSSRRWWATAIVASVVAPAIRTELLLVPAALVIALVFAAWSSDQARRWRSGWSTGDWIGAFVLVLGVIVVISGIGSHQSIQWLTVTRAFKHRIIVDGNWAVGSLGIGVGVLPLVAGLAALFPVRGEPPSREVRMFRCVSAAGILVFALYTAMKAAYLSTVFATRVEERNLIYIAPLLFVGTALVLSRRRVSWLGLTLAGAYTLYLVDYALYHVTQYPYQMGVQLYSDALGFAILQQGNRYLSWTPHFVRWLLLVIFAAGMLVLLAPRLLRGRERIAALVTAAGAAAVVAWSLTGQIAAATGTKSIAASAATTLKHPFGWVDAATHLRPTLYLGQNEVDQNAEWLLEFWNRSIARVSSLDGSLDGPGPAGGPNLTRSGTLFWGDDPRATASRYDYAVADLPCIELAGRPVKSHPYAAGGRVRTWELVRLTHPNRLLSNCTGIYPDDWTGSSDSAYFRYSGPPGWLRIVYSRRDWGFASGPSPVHILLGKLVINANHQPILGKVTKTIDSTIDSTQTKVAWVPVPAGGFAVHVVADKKVVPADYNPSSGDRRELGVELGYHFQTTPPKRKR